MEGCNLAISPQVIQIRHCFARRWINSIRSLQNKSPLASAELHVLLPLSSWVQQEIAWQAACGSKETVLGLGNDPNTFLLTIYPGWIFKLFTLYPSLSCFYPCGSLKRAGNVSVWHYTKQWIQRRITCSVKLLNELCGVVPHVRTTQYIQISEQTSHVWWVVRSS